jgi:hypothetical protein
MGAKLPPSSGLNCKLSLVCASASFLLGFLPLKMEVICSSETSQSEEHTLHDIRKTEDTEW